VYQVTVVTESDSEEDEEEMSEDIEMEDGEDHDVSSLTFYYCHLSLKR